MFITFGNSGIDRGCFDDSINLCLCKIFVIDIHIAAELGKIALDV